ncbi:Peptidase family C25 [Saccharicrinis carchari]|uniref:Peptidase family C25 n=1 Tax=Saccharicrinis carchari TaxID=1168039 RepID=A0A521F3A0_SACCC|nr:type IX secretion system sortase PorU [Saccharicrinis carchari]SMO90091.1 Peptidase family C25 [Saccharicrinis carchari]
MNTIKIGLWGFFCMLSMAVSSQENIILDKTVEWRDPSIINVHGEEVTLLQFSDMGDLKPETNIPMLNQTIKFPYGTTPENIQVSIQEPVFIWPTPQEHAHFKDKVLNKDINFDFSVSQSGQQYFLDLSLTPVIKPEGALSFKKLVSYSILISYKQTQPSRLKSTLKAVNYADNSVLSKGKWVKVSIAKSGIHKISYSQLKEWGVTNTAHVGLYGNGGKALPASNNEYRPDDLIENPVWHYNNAIYFYAQGPVTWEFDDNKRIFKHKKNLFSDKAYYFITEKDAPSQTLAASSLHTAEYDKEVDYFNDYAYHEIDNHNLISSGNVWFGEKFDYYSNTNHSFDFTFDNTVRGSSATVFASLAARSSTTTAFELLVNDKLLTKTYVSSVDVTKIVGYFARMGTLSTNFDVNDDNIKLNIRFALKNSQSSSLGYLDYICVNADRHLHFISNELAFRNQDMVGTGSKVKYVLSNSNNVIIWDISNPLSPLSVKTSTSGTQTEFNYAANELRDFVAFDPEGSFPTPVFEENVANQNLHASPFADYIIVSHPDFLSEANRLGTIHQNYSGMSYLVVNTKEIYNEFSSGKTDVTAIRSFVRMLYDKAGDDLSKKPKNLLLFGDGSYDNRPGIAGNTDKIPTYQSDNSIHATSSYVSDDYFGLLDPNEGDRIPSDKVDIGIGRFPVNTLEEAKIAVDKTYKYYYQQSNDQWKSNLTFVGDDGDGNIHMRDADLLTKDLLATHPEYNISKLYFDAYEKLTTTSGTSIPVIEQDIGQAITKGNLIFNYTGHGSPNVLGHEKVITKTHIASWNNIDKLALFVTATCEFSRYDEKDMITAGEELFLNPLGGAIALFSTTRIVYSNANHNLNTSFYNFAFERDTDGQPYTLGQIMRRTKNKLSSSINKLNFSLLGDPAIRLIYPNAKVNTLKINEGDVTMKVDGTPAPLDSLKALSKIKVTGQISDSFNKLKDDFNGRVFVTVYDKQSRIVTRGNDGATPFSFDTFDNIIFKGSASASNGVFETEFVIPKDIRYNFDKGKISYYAYSDESQQEAFGAFSDIIIGGIDNNADEDNTGPEIKLWLNNKNFSQGAKVGSRPILLAEISDISGINTTGNGIGHDITAVINDNNSNPIILNNDFEATINSYQEGIIKRQLPVLESGKHTLTLKAWDTHNNSSTASIQFQVSEEGGIAISDAIVFPNPLVPGQTSYISFQHDDPNSRLNIQLLIYGLNGQLVSQQNSSVISLINTIPPIELKAQTSGGHSLSPGIYLYKLIIDSQSGRKGEISGKIMVGR